VVIPYFAEQGISRAKTRKPPDAKGQQQRNSPTYAAQRPLLLFGLSRRFDL
jgi:hypothetical protein